MQKTLVILAAGIGSRFGGVKQLEPVGPSGEIIIDYSIHDAIAAGFNKLIFIIRREIEADFREVIGNRVEAICEKLQVEVHYVFQDIRCVPIPFPEGRTKPWGTGHAVMACDGLISEPFAVINSDDYYGKESFRKASLFLETKKYGLIGYILKNTLSENGGVTRGICSIGHNQLIGVTETRDIRQAGDAILSDNGPVSSDALVSMNFWCFPAAFMEILKDRFPAFLETMPDPLTSEYLLPVIVDALLQEGIRVSVLKSHDQWVGMTYREDRPHVLAHFQALHDAGEYPDPLYDDLLK